MDTTQCTLFKGVDQVWRLLYEAWRPKEKTSITLVYYPNFLWISGNCGNGLRDNWEGFFRIQLRNFSNLEIWSFIQKTKLSVGALSNEHFSCLIFVIPSSVSRPGPVPFLFIRLLHSVSLIDSVCVVTLILFCLSVSSANNVVFAVVL